MPLPTLVDWQFGLASLAFAFGRSDTGNNYDATAEGLVDRNVELVTVPFETEDGEYLARVRRTPKQGIFTVTINQPRRRVSVTDRHRLPRRVGDRPRRRASALEGAGHHQRAIRRSVRAAGTRHRSTRTAPTSAWSPSRPSSRVSIPVIRDAVTDAVVRY
jgi:hypothetical protein